ncbi:methyl-accepting chemotaxis protein [uncultured Pseudomonas sp.]|uniref:methyl-accepting chemotaxis protein n=1 Tax=uncultured Pseudomonas sp. TaxID=114707 RepID=UPI0025EF9FA1|nr:methyl-accepting chemotaxis protein [uncultured Pseudomonas sp.]
MSLRSLKIGNRALLCFTSFAVLLICIGSFSLVQIGKLRDSEQQVEQNILPSIMQAALLETTILRIRLETLRFISTSDPELSHKTAALLKQERETFVQGVSDYQKLASADSERQAYQELLQLVGPWRSALDEVLRQSESNGMQAAQAVVTQSFRPLSEPLLAKVQALIKANHEEASQVGHEATTLYHESLTYVIASMVLALVMTLLIAWRFTLSLVTPIRRSMAVAESIAAGDLLESWQDDGRDEIHQLSLSFERMRLNLVQTLQQISDSAIQLSSAATEMHAVTEDANRGLNQQNQEIEQAATAVNQMTAAVEEVARNAESTSHEARSSDVASRQGKASVEQTVQAIEALNGNVVDSSDRIQQLANDVGNITKVLEVIRGVAEQTNLLALNAAIEAARAGDAGRGFAVVADEVRALAQRTQQSTQEIETVIGQVQRGSSEAVNTMNATASLAQRTLALARDSDQSLAVITRAVTGITERTTLIATAAEEQAHVAREVDRALVTIRDLSVQSAAGASQTATASSELSQLAVQMNRLVGRFKVA